MKSLVNEFRARNAEALNVIVAVKIANRLIKNSSPTYISFLVPVNKDNILVLVIILTRQVGNIPIPPKVGSRLKEVLGVSTLSYGVEYRNSGRPSSAPYQLFKCSNHVMMHMEKGVRL